MRFALCHCKDQADPLGAHLLTERARPGAATAQRLPDSGICYGED